MMNKRIIEIASRYFNIMYKDDNKSNVLKNKVILGMDSDLIMIQNCIKMRKQKNCPFFEHIFNIMSRS